MLRNGSFFILSTWTEVSWSPLAQLLILSPMHSSCCVAHLTFVASHFSSFTTFPILICLDPLKWKVTWTCLFLTVGVPGFPALHMSVTRVIPGYFTEIQAQLRSVTRLEWHSMVWVWAISHCFRGFQHSLPWGCTAHMLWGDCSFTNKTSSAFISKRS